MQLETETPPLSPSAIRQHLANMTNSTLPIVIRDEAGVYSGDRPPEGEVSYSIYVKGAERMTSSGVYADSSVATTKLASFFAELAFDAQVSAGLEVNNYPVDKGGGTVVITFKDGYDPQEILGKMMEHLQWQAQQGGSANVAAHITKKLDACAPAGVPSLNAARTR